MRYLVLVLVLLSVTAIIGCGQSNLDDKVASNSGRLQKIERELVTKVETMSGRLENVERRLESEVAALKESADTIMRSLEKLSGGEIDFGKVGEDEGKKYGEVLEQLEDLKQEVVALQAELSKVEEQVSSRTVSALDHRNAYRDMGDPVKLAEKLDTFVKEYGPKLDESGRRAEFEADIEEYRAEATREYTTEELLMKYRESISQRMEEAGDDRMREWYNRQLKALESSSEEALQTRLTNYRRYENMRELSEIAREYGITRTDFRNYGLQIYGGSGGVRSSEPERDVEF
jgi:hypothetical protein